MTTDNKRSKNARRAPSTSPNLESLRDELTYASLGIENLKERLTNLRKLVASLNISEEDLKLIEFGRATKKNFAQRFSSAISQKIANALRIKFASIYPTVDGSEHESLSAGAGGPKKIDINYSSTQRGLELAISIKTMNFPDEKTKRYTKNAKRVDGELRAEAQDIHKRQPYAVLVALWFLPKDSASDGSTKSPSSLCHIARILAARTGRKDHNDDQSKFELAFLCLYNNAGSFAIVRPSASFPERGLPCETITLREALDEVCAAYKLRNAP
jgi:hypothetical protein